MEGKLRRHARTAAGLITFAATLATAATAAAAPNLDVYVGDVPRAQLGKLVAIGVDRQEIDLSAARAGGKDNIHVEAILNADQADQLADEGVDLAPKKIDGQTVA